MQNQTRKKKPIKKRNGEIIKRLEIRVSEQEYDLIKNQAHIQNIAMAEVVKNAYFLDYDLYNTNKTIALINQIILVIKEMRSLNVSIEAKIQNVEQDDKETLKEIKANIAERYNSDFTFLKKILSFLTVIKLNTPTTRSPKKKEIDISFLLEDEYARYLLEHQEEIVKNADYKTNGSKRKIQRV